MATTIKLKNGSGAPAASDLVQGEPAIDLTNKRLYTEDSGGSVIEVGTNPSSLSIDGTAITATATEINTLDGITSTTAELNILDGVTSTAAELNILDGVTASTAEINLLDGVTSTTDELNILDGVTSTAAELNILDGVTATTAELNILDGVTSTTAELNILDGVTATAAELNVLDGVTAFVDEDDMSSDSATSIPSQQSVKAYVDSTTSSQVSAQDLDFEGDTGGALSINLDSETLTIAGGTGIDTSGATNTLTVAIDSTVATLTGSQTLTNKTLTTPVISSISNTGTLTLPTSTDTLVGRDTTDTLTNKTLTSPVLNTGVSGTAILDEDDMVSDSATQLATQQSIKAYVDSQVASKDTLSELGDTNITTPADGALLFYDADNSEWIDNVVSGDITIADTGVAAISSGVIVNDDINSSAAISVSKTALVDGTGLTLTGDTLSVDASQTQITAVGTISTGTWQGTAITDTYVANDLTISGGTIENTPIGAATPNTGEFTTLTASGDLTVDTNTLYVDSANNNVGIGTTSPTGITSGITTLAISDAGAKTTGDKTGALSFITNDGSYTGTYSDGVGVELAAVAESATGGAYGLTITTGTAGAAGRSERVRINNAGYVGIGVADPDAELEVQSSSPTLKISNDVAKTSGEATIGQIEFAQHFGTNSSSRIRGIEIGGSTAYVSGGLTFFTRASGSSLGERMRINSGGDIGIGDTDPQCKLSIRNGSGEGTLIECYGSTDGKTRAWSLSSGTRNGFSGAEWEYNIASSGGEHVFSNITKELMRIDNNGNLGIGTDDPSRRLTVRSPGSNNIVAVCQNAANTSEIFNITEVSNGDGRLQIRDSGNTTRVQCETGGVYLSSGKQFGILNESTTSTLITGFGYTSANGYANVFWGSASAGAGRVDWRTNSSVNMILENDGDLLVGRSSASSSVSGHYFLAGGKANHTTSDTEQLILNRINTATTGNKIMITFRINGVVSGSIVTPQGGTPSFSSASDVRLKENITDHESELSNVMSLRPVRWDWQDEQLGSGEGFVAQELEQTGWSDLVSDGDDGYKQVAGLGPVETRLIKALQEAVTRIETLEAQVAELQGAN